MHHNFLILSSAKGHLCCFHVLATVNSAAMSPEVHVSPSILVSLVEVKWSEKSLSRLQLFATPWTVAHQAPPSMEFSRQEYWSGLPFPSPGDLPDAGIKPQSPALWADALPSEPQGSPFFPCSPLPPSLPCRFLLRALALKKRILGSNSAPGRPIFFLRVWLNFYFDLLNTYKWKYPLKA